MPSKPTEFIGSSRRDLREFPQAVKYEIGHAIYLASLGLTPRNVKPMKGDIFKGAGVLEVVDDFDGNTYRAVYTVKFDGVVYVLHAFQKKAKKGIATPKHEIDVIKLRLDRARAHYQSNYLE